MLFLSIIAFCLWISGQYRLSKKWVCILPQTWGHQMWSRSREQTKLSIRSRSTGHSPQMSLHLHSSAQGKSIHGNLQSHAALATAQTPSMHSLQYYEDYPEAMATASRPPGISQSTVIMSDLQLFCFLISCTQHAYQSFFITGVWSNVWASQSECGYASVQTA